MAGNPEVTSIIAVLVGMVAPPGPEAPEFGQAIKGHILGSEIELPFGQQLKPPLLAAVQPEPEVLGIAPFTPDHSVF